MEQLVEIAERIPEDVFKFTERKLYGYKRSKELLASMQRQLDDILTMGSKHGDANAWIRPQGTHGDPVGERSVRALILERGIHDLTFWVQAIEDGLTVLTEQQRQLVRLKYFDRLLTNEGVMREMRLSNRAFYGLRNEIIEVFAIRFGLVQR